MATSGSKNGSGKDSKKKNSQAESKGQVEKKGRGGRTTNPAAAASGLSAPKSSKMYLLAKANRQSMKKSVPDFQSGDTVKVHTKIIEGNKERIQIFQGIVTKRHRGNLADATFTVRKVSYNIGVERTFPLHSPRVEKIEVVSQGEVRRARLYYLRDLQGKAAKIKSQIAGDMEEIALQGLESEEAAPASEAGTEESNGASTSHAVPAEGESSTMS